VILQLRHDALKAELAGVLKYERPVFLVQVLVEAYAGAPQAPVCAQAWPSARPADRVIRPFRVCKNQDMMGRARCAPPPNVY
jgi:hypothetical protein